VVAAVAAEAVGATGKYALSLNIDNWIFTGSGKILTVKRYSRELRAQYSFMVLRPTDIEEAFKQIISGVPFVVELEIADS
ncbi:MAG: hypothetical protein WAN11_28860, partial [Syntrophobacteraceae bacterium]